LQAAALARLQTWAAFLDPDFQHSKRVSELAVQLYDGLEKGKVFRPNDRARRILHAAALLHNVGLARSKRGHHKESYRLIRAMAVPLGWSPQELNAVAAVVRYHRGALPRPEHKCMKRIPRSARERLIRLAAVLRLADELDRSPATKTTQLAVERNHGTVVVRGQGYAPLTASAQRIAAARHLLEATCDVAVVVRPS
jgi:exopolyphosphatase/guanosine-5'-triphosphate,3'-diphosphate pyrophosphatase